MEILRNLIVPAHNAEQARTICAEHPAGAGMFTTPLYTGQDVTHYVSSGWMPEEIVQSVADLANVSDLPPLEAIEQAGLSLCAP